MSKTQLRKLVKVKGARKALRVVRAAAAPAEVIALAEALDKKPMPG